MSLLSIAQSILLRVLSQKPTVAATSTDPKTQQAVEFINEAGQELAARHSWQVLVNESTFLTTGNESQGTIQALSGPGYSYVLNETMWNRTQRRPLFGPKSSSEWQLLKAQFSSGPWSSYRIRQNQVLFFPTTPVGHNIYFEWVTSNWASDKVGTPQSSYVADTDLTFLDERLIKLDALWRFKRANNLAYDEDFDKAEKAIEDAIARDGSRARLTLTGTPNELVPVAVVPLGNWMVPP